MGSASPAVELELGFAGKGSEHGFHKTLLGGEVEYCVVKLISCLEYEKYKDLGPGGTVLVLVPAARDGVREP